MRQYPGAAAGIVLLLCLVTGCTTPPPCGDVPLPTPARIMPLGDSITHGMASQDSYRRLLYQQLVAAGYAVDFVGSQRTAWENVPHPHNDFDPDHEGHWGWRAEDILYGLPALPAAGKLPLWLAQQQPDVVLVHIGSNDMNHGQPVAGTVAEIGTIIATIRESNPHTVILLAQLIPWNDPRVETGIRALNADIAELAARSTTPASPVILVDQHSGFDPARDTVDGVHPNAEGEAKMARNWFRALELCLL